MFKKIKAFLKRKLKGEQILCDTCRYNYGNVCFRRERPNAKECPEYKAKG